MSDGNSSIVITDRHSTLIALLLLEWQSVKLYRDEIIKHISTDQPINWKPGGSAHRIQAALHPIQLFKSVNHNVISNWPLWGSWVSLYATVESEQQQDRKPANMRLSDCELVAAKGAWQSPRGRAILTSIWLFLWPLWECKSNTYFHFTQISRGKLYLFYN